MLVHLCTTRTHEMVTTGIIRSEVRYKVWPQKLVNYCSILRYWERQVDGRESVSKARKSVRIQVLCFILFGTLTCLSFPCAADLIDPAVKDRYLMIPKLLLGALNDLIVNIISVSSTCT